MKKTFEKIHLDNYTTIEVDDVGDLIVEFDDGDEQFSLDLPAREILAHLREFFDE